MASSRASLRRWGWVHKWSSIVCTVFMLLLCVTGLPLIFHHEIDDLLHEEVKAATVPEGTPLADLDRVVANGLAAVPGQVAHFLIWLDEDPDAVMLSVGKSMDADPSTNRFVRVDAHTGAYLDSPDVTGRFTYIMLKLHTDMFAGLPGKLFLGLMGILFCAAIVSGIVVYAPSMRKLKFGTYRRDRLRVVRWLDIHNLTGIMLVMWMLVVGFTGVINTWADLVIKIWQYGQLAEMTAVQGQAAGRDADLDRGRGAHRARRRAGDEAGLRRVPRQHLQQQEPLCRVPARQHAADLEAAQAGADRR